MVVLVGLLAALLVYRCALLDAGVVRLEIDTRVVGEVEDLLHGLTRGNVLASNCFF